MDKNKREKVNEWNKLYVEIDVKECETPPKKLFIRILICVINLTILSQTTRRQDVNWIELNLLFDSNAN